VRESLPYRRLFCVELSDDRRSTERSNERTYVEALSKEPRPNERKLSVGSKTTERLNGRIYVEILQESRLSRSGFSRDNTLAADAVGAALNDEQL